VTAAGSWVNDRRRHTFLDFLPAVFSPTAQQTLPIDSLHFITDTSDPTHLPSRQAVHIICHRSQLHRQYFFQFTKETGLAVVNPLAKFKVYLHPFQKYGRGFKIFKRVTWPRPCPFRGKFFTPRWTLPYPTHLPNLKSIASSVPENWRSLKFAGKQTCRQTVTDFKTIPATAPRPLRDTAGNKHLRYFTVLCYITTFNALCIAFRHFKMCHSMHNW